MRLGQIIAVIVLATLCSIAGRHQRIVSGGQEIISLKPLIIPAFPNVPISTLNCDKTISFACLPLASQELVASVSAKTFLVLDRKTGVVVASYQAGRPMYPASTVKLLTALMVKQRIDPTQTITVQKQDISLGGSSFFRVGEEMSVTDALAAMLIASDNSIAFALAREASDSADSFVQAMNQNADSYQLTNSSFSNPAGLDALNQKATAWDLSVLGRWVVSDSYLSLFVASSEWMPTSFPQNQPFKNTNLLLNHPELHTIGIKTGTTPMAGEVLVSLFQTETRDWLIVVMGSRDRFTDTLTLLHWAQTEVHDTNIHDFAADFSQASHVE